MQSNAPLRLNVKAELRKRKKTPSAEDNASIPTDGEQQPETGRQSFRAGLV